MSVYRLMYILLLGWPLCYGDHYKGGTITWRALNPASLTSPVQLVITTRQSWTLSRYPCNATNLNVIGAYNDTNNVTSSELTCISSSATCTTAGFVNISVPFVCTDYSSALSVSTGSFFSSQSYPLNTVIDIAWRGASWSTDTYTNVWSMISRINLTPVSGRINSPPVTISLPVTRVLSGSSATVDIIAVDENTDQVVRCRWSYQLPDDECGSVCFSLPNAQLNAETCSISWTASLRAADMAAGLNKSIYVIAVTAEDFVNATSTTPLSSTPHQMLVEVYTLPSNRCLTGNPTFSGFPRSDQTCYGIGSSVSIRIVGRVSCLNDTIVEYVTSTPYNMYRSNITQLSNFTWALTFSWTPTANQIGIHPFCVAVIDNHGVSSGTQCIALAVGGTNPSAPVPLVVQGSASPLGTVMATHTRFSIRANMPLQRTKRDGKYIRINRVSVGQVYSLDAKRSGDIFLLNTTLEFYVRNPPWVLGATYTVSFDPGVITANNTCATEDLGFSGSYWVFTIWNPAMSSTTTPSTTTSTVTVGTVTTRSIATTTPNTMLTTTGISAVTTITTTTTSSTSSLTTTTTTTATTTTTTTTVTTEYIPNAVVIYPKDMEKACVQPVTIATLIVTLAMLPLHLYAMINLFVKMNAHFQKEAVKKKIARRHRAPTSMNDAEETETLF